MTNDNSERVVFDKNYNIYDERIQDIKLNELKTLIAKLSCEDLEKYKDTIEVLKKLIKENGELIKSLKENANKIFISESELMN